MNTSNSWKCVLLAVLLGWAYLPTIIELYQKWTTEPQYSHGILVPLFAGYLFLRQRDRVPSDPTPWPWLGIVVLCLALGCRMLAAMLAFLPIDGLSLVLCITGLVLILGGKDLLRCTWQSLVFLLFMIPLPYQLERMMGAELQRFATIATTFVLQTLGQPAIIDGSTGNTILLREIRLGVVEACSGLRMLVTFLAFSVAAVMIMERHWFVKLLILLSAVPIALVANILRITVTGLAHVYLRDSASKEPVLHFIHDFNGWMMMPVGLTLLMAELWLFKHLFIEKPTKRAIR